MGSEMCIRDRPWRNAQNVLFILDASHEVEETLLRDWLSSEMLNEPITGNVTYCVVPIADDPENIPTQGLAQALELDSQTLVVPVRVVWKTPLDASHGKPKLRDLWRGNPRRPSKRKAKKILQKSPNLAQCIVGKPALLEDLSTRYQQRSSIAVISANLADYVAEQASLALEVGERRLRGSRYKVPRQVSKQVRASDGYKLSLIHI